MQLARVGVLVGGTRRRRALAAGARGGGAAMSALLFMSVFTSQAAVLVLSPILVEIAADFDVSTATAGRLRIVAAPSPRSLLSRAPAWVAVSLCADCLL